MGEIRKEVMCRHETVHSKPWVQDTERATSRQLGKSRSHEKMQRTPNVRACNLGDSAAFTMEK